MKLPIQIALAALIVALIVHALLYDMEQFGINLALAQSVFLAGAYALSYLSKHKLPARAHIAAAFAFSYALIFAIWTSEITLALASFGFLVANTLFVLFAYGYSVKERHFLGFLPSLGRSIGHIFERLDILPELRPRGVSEKTVRVFVGLAIALPILIIFTALFVSADMVFEKQLSSIIEWLEYRMDVENIIGRSVHVGFILSFAMLFFAGAFWKRFEIKRQFATRVRGKIESMVVLTCVNGLFAIFLAIQGVYLFGGEAYLRRMELTYSEYAVSGFFELMAVVSLVYLMIITLRYFHHERTNKILHGLYAVLIAQTGLILVSAFMRMNLYVDVYGFTPSRIFGYVYMATAAMVIMMTLVNILLEKSQSLLIRDTLVVLASSILLFAVLTPDGLSVKLNAARALEGKQPLQTGDLRVLSEEAYPAFLDAIRADVPIDGVWTNLGHQNEYCGINYYGDGLQATKDDWRSWNYSRTRYCDSFDSFPENGTEL